MSSPSNNLKEQVAEKLFEKIKYGVGKSPDGVSHSQIMHDWHYEFASETVNLTLDTILASKEMQLAPDKKHSVGYRDTDYYKLLGSNQAKADLRAMLEGMKS